MFSLRDWRLHALEGYVRRLCHTTLRSMLCSIASSLVCSMAQGGRGDLRQRNRTMMQDIKLPCNGRARQIALTVSSKQYEGEVTAIRSAPEWTRRQIQNLKSCDFRAPYAQGLASQGKFKTKKKRTDMSTHKMECVHRKS